jgi:starch synthase
MTVKALSVASEVFPLVKTGGLADVAGALPAALKPHGVETVTLIPGYPAVMRELSRGEVVRTYTDVIGAPMRAIRGNARGIDVIALDAPALYARDGGPYADPAGRDWPDNWRRYAALGIAAADLARTQGFDIVHAHDWQGAMAPVYLRFSDGAKPKALVTIHNMAFPGRFEASIFPALKLPPAAYAIDGVEFYGGVGFLKGGLWAADAVTTVSPTYAEEILKPEFGMGFEGLIAARRKSVFGIVNGIDTAIWNPAADPALASIFDVETLELRAENRSAVETAFGLTGDGPIFCVVSRLTLQKGMDVLADVADALVETGGRLALLGSGDPALEAAFRTAALRHPGRIGVKIGYDEKLSHRMQGGADAILIPSRFEPCGLTQLCGLRYGCVPIAARTGGLADTIIDANAAALSAGVATGILFDGVATESLARAIRRAVEIFADAPAWRALQVQGMTADVSWSASAKAYAGLYARLIKG